MDLGPLRALALGLNFQAFGVAATVTRPAPDDVPIETRVVWITPATEDLPANSGLARRDQIRVLALSKADVPTIPRLTRIVAAEIGSAEARTWRVDDFVSADTQRVHVAVTLIEEP